jgi:hypothetical protein
MSEPIADTGSPLLDTLANHLQDSDVGTIGQDIFVHFMPEDVTSGILLLDNYVYRTTSEIPGYRRAQFRIVVRARTHKEGNTTSSQAIAALSMIRRTFDSVEIKICEQMHDPIPFPPPTHTNSKEFVTNFSVVYGLIQD